MPDILSQFQSLTNNAIRSFQEVMQVPLNIGNSLISGAAEAAKGSATGLAGVAETLTRPFTDIKKMFIKGPFEVAEAGSEIVGAAGAHGERTHIF